VNSLWDILSVAIGVSFVFMILSILNSWIQEYISSMFGLRARNLADVMQNLLEPGASRLNGLLKVYMPYINSDRGGNLMGGLEETAKKVLKRQSVEKYRPLEKDVKRWKEHTTTSEDLGTLDMGAIIEPIDEVVNDEGEWIQYRFEEGNAWVKKDQLAIVNKYRPTVENLNIRKDSNVNSASLDTLGIKAVVEAIQELVNKEGEGWIRINFGGKAGYLNKKYLEKLEEGESLSNRVDNIAVSLLRRDPINQWERGAEDVIDKLKDNPVRFFYEHPVLYSLAKPGKLPDHLPTKDFTVALLDALDDAGRDKGGKIHASEKITIDNIKKGIEKLDNKLADRLRSLLYSAQINSKNGEVDLENFQNAVGEWFDDTFTRGKVWYKRNMQRVGIICGVFLAVLLNADTIGISNALWHNSVLRESISQAAEATARQGEAPNSDQAQQQLEELMSLGLPIGWSFDTNPADPRAFPSTTGGWISKSIGLLLTGFAISQGSQIWFDLMNRLINLRSSGFKSPSEEQATKKEE